MAHKVELPRPWWTRWWVWVILLMVVGQAAALFVGSVLRVEEGTTKPAVETLSCASRETFRPVPSPVFEVIVPPVGDCWTAWFVRPDINSRLLIGWGGGRFTLELAYADGRTEVVDDVSPLRDVAPTSGLTGVRFKNRGPNTISVTIQVAR